MRSGLPVALKVYYMAMLASFNRHQVLREVRLHASLDHPHIIQLYAAFQVRGARWWTPGGVGAQLGEAPVSLPVHGLLSHGLLQRKIGCHPNRMNGPPMPTKFCDLCLYLLPDLAGLPVADWLPLTRLGCPTAARYSGGEGPGTCPELCLRACL
jgi:hypothetical protein